MAQSKRILGAEAILGASGDEAIHSLARYDVCRRA